MSETNNMEQRMGLQKNISEIFDGVSVPSGLETVISAKRDTGPENPMVAGALLHARRKMRDSQEAARGVSAGQKAMVFIAVLVCAGFVGYYLTTHQAPPLVLVVALFVLYLIGLSIGAVHMHKVAKLRQNA